MTNLPPSGFAVPQIPGPSFQQTAPAPPQSPSGAPPPPGTVVPGMSPSFAHQLVPSAGAPPQQPLQMQATGVAQPLPMQPPPPAYPGTMPQQHSGAAPAFQPVLQTNIGMGPPPAVTSARRGGNSSHDGGL